MEEKQVYYNGDIFISNKKFSVGGTTYPIKSISGVKIVVEKIGRKLEMMFLLIGIFIFYATYKFSWFIDVMDSYTRAIGSGVGAIVIAFLLWKFRRPTYSLRLTSGGKTELALSNKDKKFIAEVKQKLNEAISIA